MSRRMCGRCGGCGYMTIPTDERQIFDKWCVCAKGRMLKNYAEETDNMRRRALALAGSR